MKNFDPVDQAVKVLREGGVIILPTDTVWGIGASISRLEAIKRLYQIKGRERAKPTAVLVADIMTANTLGVIDEEIKLLISKFWPGGLTLVVRARLGVPKLITGQKGTIGLRQPAHPQALAILERLGTGLVAASANFAGQAPPGQKELIDQELVDQADFLLEGKSGGRPPSTVLDTTARPFKILREGEITAKMLNLSTISTPGVEASWN